MSVVPIVKVYDAAGALRHSCAANGCQVSWDGYVLVDGYTVDVYDDATGELVSSTPLAAGQRVQGATDPAAVWDTSIPGEAHHT